MYKNQSESDDDINQGFVPLGDNQNGVGSLASDEITVCPSLVRDTRLVTSRENGRRRNVAAVANIC